MTQVKAQQLSPQIFTIWSDEIKIRIDPYYHQSYFKDLYKEINSCKKVAKLKDIVRELDYGLMPTQDYAESRESGVPMIRVTNIMFDGGIDMTDVKYIPFDTPRLSVKRVKENDILMVQCGSTTGKVALVPQNLENCTFGSFSFVIRGKEEIVNQNYLFIILMSRLVQEQIKHTWNIVTVRPNTSKPAVENLLIPLPPLSVQNKIVSIMQKVFREKREKEIKANKLLKSIDDYVLDELGIKVPEIKREMVFEIMSDKIEDRMDIEYYQKFYKLFVEEIKKCKFQKEPLENITEFIMNGRTPARDDYVNDAENGIPLIKAGTASGKLVDLGKVGYVKNGFKGKQAATRGDIFILSAAHQAEYVGKNVSLLDEEPNRNTYFVGELVGIRANPEKCLSEYLFGFLSSQFVFVLINREKRGQTSHLYPEDLKNLLIPLPPLSIQKKIVDKLKSCRTQARNLQNEVRENLQKAKDKVEQIILG